MYETNMMDKIDPELMEQRQQNLEILEHEKFGTYSLNDILIVHYENPGLFNQIQLFKVD
jgi:hypothetical protein